MIIPAYYMSTGELAPPQMTSGLVFSAEDFPLSLLCPTTTMEEFFKFVDSLDLRARPAECPDHDAYESPISGWKPCTKCGKVERP